MKKYLLALALIMVSASAMAGSDEISCKGEKNCQVKTGTGTSNNMADACRIAKNDTIAGMAVADYVVDSYSSCKDGCVENKGQWSCSIDARVLRK